MRPCTQTSPRRISFCLMMNSRARVWISRSGIGAIPYADENVGCTNGPPDDLEWYWKHSVSVSSGMLHLTARKQHVHGYNYASGMIVTGGSPHAAARIHILKAGPPMIPSSTCRPDSTPTVSIGRPIPSLGTSTAMPSRSSPRASVIPHKPMYILVDLALGGWISFPNADTRFPATMPHKP
jgi:hypothetical protein